MKSSIKIHRHIHISKTFKFVYISCEILPCNIKCLCSLCSVLLISFFFRATLMNQWPSFSHVIWCHYSVSNKATMFSWHLFEFLTYALELVSLLLCIVYCVSRKCPLHDVCLLWIDYDRVQGLWWRSRDHDTLNFVLVTHTILTIIYNPLRWL